MAVCGLFLALSSFVDRSNHLPPTAEASLISDLVQLSAGESVRGTDFITTTAADQACEDLTKIGEPAVPYLLKALHSPKGWARVHAIEVLANIQDRRAVQPILAILQEDRETGVRGIAAYNLGAFQDLSVVPELIQAAQSNDEDVSRGAWKSLGELRTPRAIPILIEHLGATVRAIPGGNLVTDDTPINALTKIGAPAVMALTECLAKPDKTIQKNAAIALGGIGTPEAAANLTTALSNLSSRNAAIYGFLESSLPSSVPVAIQALGQEEFRSDAAAYFDTHPDPRCLPALKKAIAADEVRPGYGGNTLRDGVDTIRKLKDRSAIPLLIHLLDTKLEENETISALGEFRDNRAIPSLIKLIGRCHGLNDYDATIELACQTIAKFGTEGMDAVAVLLRERPNAAWVVGKAFSEFDDPHCESRMLRYLNPSAPSVVRAGAIDALGQMKSQASAPYLVKGMTDRSQEVRFASVLALALLGDSRAIDPLSKITRLKRHPELENEWKALGSKALSALSKLFANDDYTAAIVIAAIKCPQTTHLLIQGLRSKDPNVAALCAKSLGHRRARAATGPLQATLNSSNMDVRFEAYEALRNL